MSPTEKVMHQLNYVARGGVVQRMHMIPVLHRQNVAAHSFGVAWWCWALTNEKPSVNLLMAALAHDLAEGVVGDIPAPTKRMLQSGALDQAEHEADYNGGMPVFELTEEEARVLKLADSMDLLHYCVCEAQLGNRTAQLGEMFVNVCSYAQEKAVSGEFELIMTLHAKWCEVCNGH